MPDQKQNKTISSINSFGSSQKKIKQTLQSILSRKKENKSILRILLHPKIEHSQKIFVTFPDKIATFTKTKITCVRSNIMLLGVIILLCLSSCKTFYPNVMFQTPKDYQYVDLETMPAPEYLIRPGDKITFQAYTNMGFSQIQSVVPAFEGGAGTAGQNMQLEYLIRSNGSVELPITGEVDLAGLSIPQAEELLKEKISTYYKNPLVVLKVVNRRAYVYTGGSEAAIVVPIEEENLTLIEVISLAGGINPDGKAFKVKVIRGTLDDPMIAIYDLSTIDGMKRASVIIQPEDIIYVEPTTKFASGLLREISPYLGLIGSITSIVSIILIYSRTSNGN